jgi:hypothetical protein
MPIISTSVAEIRRVQQNSCWMRSERADARHQTASALAAK